MLWVMAACALLAEDNASTNEEFKPTIHEVRGALSAEKSDLLKTLNEDLIDAKDRQKRVPRDRNRKKALAELKNEINALGKRIDRLESGKDDPPIPTFSGGKRLAVGSFGLIDGPSDEIKVTVIVSHNECIGYWTYSETHLDVSKNGGYSIERQRESPFLVRGIPTKDFAEGARFPLRGTYRISGQSNWRGRTLFVLEPFDVRRFVAEHENDRIK